MATIFGKYGSKYPNIGRFIDYTSYRFNRRRAAKYHFHTPESKVAVNLAISFREKLNSGKTVYLVGIGAGTHNAGVALIECSLEKGIILHSNHEEERFSGIKHAQVYPKHSIEALQKQLKDMNLTYKDIHAFLGTFNYVNLLSSGWMFEEPKTFLRFLKNPFIASNEKGDRIKEENYSISQILFGTSNKLREQFNLNKPVPIIGMRHHDNHAFFSYAVSPFNKTNETVMVIVMDGTGDDGSLSLYKVCDGQVEMVYDNKSFYDSLGHFYAILSSTQGGWTPLSSEGRYMGAAAWGNRDRMTNPYYSKLRQVFYFSNDGEVLLNRALANWHVDEITNPYTNKLEDIIGKPINRKDMWNPDKILNVEDIKHAEITRDRLDKAAATQMVFEDALFHIVGHFIRSTGSSKLVLSGGTALNCIANMHLLEHFNEDYYKRYLNQTNARLHIWVPPTPGDAGVTMGAAYAFAMQNGCPVGESINHAFYCGFAPKTSEIEEALQISEEISYLRLGNIQDEEKLKEIADLMAYIVEKNGIIGVFQGIAETGPRALGHRSILANPTNSKTREILNSLVKSRELVRPLAPMATFEAADKFFNLAKGASDANFNAYNYMVLTAKAKQEAFKMIPSVIHQDGTSRVQIVRPETDPLIYAYLKANGKRIGVEVSVNTSLNVGGPIVQTAIQGLDTLKKSKGMHGLFIISEEGDTYVAWHNIKRLPKDEGKTLLRWIQEWRLDLKVPIQN